MTVCHVLDMGTAGGIVPSLSFSLPGRPPEVLVMIMVMMVVVVIVVVIWAPAGVTPVKTIEVVVVVVVVPVLARPPAAGRRRQSSTVVQVVHHWTLFVELTCVWKRERGGAITQVFVACIWILSRAY